MPLPILWAKFRDACLELSSLRCFPKRKYENKRFSFHFFCKIECTLTTRSGSLRLCLYSSLRMPACPQSSHYMQIAVALSRKCILLFDRIKRRMASNETHTVEKWTNREKNKTELPEYKIDVAPSAMQIMSEKCFRFFFVFLHFFHINSACVYRRLWLASTKYGCIQRVNTFCHSVYSFHVRRRCRRLGRIIYSFLFTAFWNFIVWHFTPFR